MENALKKEKKKHDHKLTKLLKVGIFSLVMLAPFMSVTSTCAYMTFNKNAELPPQQETFITKNTYQTNEVNSNTDLIQNNIYMCYGGGYITNIHHAYAYLDGYYIEYKAEENKPFYIENGNLYDYYESIILEDFSSYLYLIWEDNFFTSPHNTIDYEDFGISDFLPNYYTTQEQTIYDNSNAFYYAVDQLQESELFNWTQNTAIYSGIYGLTNGMGNNNPTMAILLTYWTITTCIYVIFDIVIELFIWLTHLIGER